MESRKITIVTTVNGQSKKVIMSSATTLGELKTDLNANGISYEDMDFYEGVSKTKILNDDSILPANVPYKGTTTNELVFMLSTTNKKIRSGATLTRPAIYARIKEMNLQDAIKLEFGRNFTQVSTDDLISFINENEVEETPAPTGITSNLSLHEAFKKLLDVLCDNGIIDDDDDEEIKVVLYKDCPTVSSPQLKAEPVLESSYDEDELDEMINSL